MHLIGQKLFTFSETCREIFGDFVGGFGGNFYLQWSFWDNFTNLVGLISNFILIDD